MNRQEKALGVIEEGMQSANKVSWKDIRTYESKDVPWKIKCRRLVDHVDAVLGVRIGLGPYRPLKGSRGGRLRQCCVFSASEDKEETWVDYYARTCKTARKTWIQMGLLCLYEVIAGSMWRAMGWVCDERPNAVINTLRNVHRWRSTSWWQSLQAKKLKEYPCNHAWWKHKWGWHNRGNVWDKITTDWAGKEDWMSERKKRCTCS